MDRCIAAEAEAERLRRALVDIAYVGTNGRPIGDQEAVTKWCRDRAAMALNRSP